MAGNEVVDPNDPATWMSPAEVAELSGVTPRSVRRACDQGRIEHRTATVAGRRRYLIKPAAAETWIRSRRRPERRLVSAPQGDDDTGLLLELAMARGRITELELANVNNMLAAERDRSALEVRVAQLASRLEHVERDERRWRHVVAALSAAELHQGAGTDS